MFYQHCAKECNTEAFEFCLEIFKFEAKATPEQAQQIIKTFIEPQSQKEINVSNKIREAILKADLQDAQRLPTLFQKAHFANLLLLSQDVFSRFIRTQEFFKFVSATPDKQLQSEFGAQLMSQLPEYTLHKDNMTRASITPQDVSIASHMLKDYYSWELLAHEKNLNLSMYHAKKGTVGSDLIEQYGKWSLSKLVLQVQELNALEVLHIMTCQNYMHIILPTMPNHKVVQKFDNPNEYSYTITHQDVVIPLSQARDSVTVNSVMYNASSKTYYVMYKSCDHDSYPQSKKVLRAVYYTVYFIREIDDKRCLLQAVIASNYRGYVQSFMDVFGVGYLTTVGKAIASGVQKAKQDYKSNYEKIHKHEYATPYDKIPGFVDCINAIGMLQSNGAKNVVFPI